MARAITADGARAGAIIIEQRYREGDTHQFLRELTQNGIEAGATKIQFGIHWDGVNRNWDEVAVPSERRIHSDRYRIVYYDNGSGMGAKMGDYMAGLLDLDSKDQAAGDPHGNFGIGARVSLLPWNKAGVIVASWSHERPEGRLMWIHHVPDASDKLGFYEAATLEWEDDDGEHCDEVAPADAFPEFVSDRPDWLGQQADGSVGTGTMFLLLGNTGQEHTFLGPEGAWMTHTGPNYLTHRYWAHPPNLDLRYEDPRASSTESWASRSRDRVGKTALNGSKARKDERVFNEPVRSVQGLVSGNHSKAGAPKPSYEAIDLPDGGKMHIHLLPKKTSTGGGGRRIAERPGIAVLYKGELYHRRDSGRDYQRFAVVNSEIYRRLSIVIEPRLADQIDDPNGGILPTGSRTTLHYIAPLGPKGDRPAGHDLPWNQWQDVFVNQMPRFVEDAIAELIDDDDGDYDKDIVEQVAVPFMDLFRRMTWIEDDHGDTTGTVLNQLVRKRRKRQNVRRVSSGGSNPADGNEPGSNGSATGGSGSTGNGGESRGTEVSVGAAIPDCVFDAGAFTEDDRNAKVRVGVRYSPGKRGELGKVFIDEAFPIIDEVKKYWAEQFAEQHFTDVIKSVKLVYRTAMACRAGQLLSMAQQSGITQNELMDTLLSDHALTASLYGLASEHAALKQRTSGYRRIK